MVKHKYLGEDLEKMKAGVALHAQAGHSMVFLSIICVVLGAVGDAVNVKIVLEPISWLLLAVVFSVSSVYFFIGWAVSWYLSTEAKSEKKE
jgi:hypothetical protein